MQIVQAPNTVLSQKAAEIKKIDSTALELIARMKQTLLGASDPEGVGLAAPQVGKSVQLFIMKPEKDSPITVIINPKVDLIGQATSRKTKNGHATLEGCLSIKDIWGTVKRARSVHVTYMDEQGKTIVKTFTGWPARVIQHEYDHLQGILFPRRVLEQQGKLYKSHKNKDGEDEFDLLTL